MAVSYSNPPALAEPPGAHSHLAIESSRVMWCSCSSGTTAAAQAAAGSSLTSPVSL
jgi:hypothetical protein